MVTEFSSSACGVHVTVALRGECLSAAGGTSWRDYTQGPRCTVSWASVTIVTPCEQVSQWHSTVASQHPRPTRVHSVSGIANEGENDREVASNAPSNVHQLSRLKFSCMYVPEWNTLWCSVSTSVSLAYEFEKALLNLLFHCLKVHRSSAFAQYLQQ